MIDLRSNYPLLGREASLLQHALQAIDLDRMQRCLLFPPWQGAREDRAVAAQWLSVQGGPVEGEAVSICTSAHHALVVLSFAAQLRGATIATEDFTYLGFRAIAQLFHMQLVPCETDEEGIIPSSFQKACEQQAIRTLYIQPTIHNPTGSILPLQRRKEIAEIAARYNILIIEDEAYRFLAPDAPPRLYDLLPQQTAFIMSLSKPFSPGLKIAYLLAPPHFSASIANALRLTSSGASALSSAIASQLIQDGTLDQLIVSKREDARLRQAWVRERLGHFSYRAFPTSYHAWFHLPAGRNSTLIAQRLQQRGVDILPGADFAVDEQRGAEYLRISLGGEGDGGRLQQGLALLREELQM